MAKCSRTACHREANPECVHLMGLDGNTYCEKCAIGINRHTPGAVALPKFGFPEELSQRIERAIAEDRRISVYKADRELVGNFKPTRIVQYTRLSKQVAVAVETHHPMESSVIAIDASDSVDPCLRHQDVCPNCYECVLESEENLGPIDHLACPGCGVTWSYNTTVREAVLDKATNLVKDLKNKGWTAKDFSNALKELFAGP